MNKRQKFIVLISSLIFSLFYWRLNVFLFYSSGGLSFLRQITGLTIHHYHYGLVFILISSLLLIFYKANIFSVGLMGFGLGSVFDGFASGLMGFNSVRAQEIYVYNQSFLLTLFILFDIILLASVFYFIGKKD